MNYILVEGGFVTQYGRLQPNMRPQGAIDVESVPRPHDGPIQYKDGKYIYLPPPPLPVAVQRAQAYPSIGDQLDAIWHAMDQGLLPKIEPMYSTILAVKQKHPKPA